MDTKTEKISRKDAKVKTESRQFAEDHKRHRDGLLQKLTKKRKVCLQTDLQTKIEVLHFVTFCKKTHGPAAAGRRRLRLFRIWFYLCVLAALREFFPFIIIPVMMTHPVA